VEFSFPDRLCFFLRQGRFVVFFALGLFMANLQLCFRLDGITCNALNGKSGDLPADLREDLAAVSCGSARLIR
jgi:hypothetical protein